MAVRPVVEEISGITDEFCGERLDEEYAGLCRRLTVKLARKRPSPLVRGDRRIWAAGIVCLAAWPDPVRACWGRWREPGGSVLTVR